MGKTEADWRRVAQIVEDGRRQDIYRRRLDAETKATPSGSSTYRVQVPKPYPGVQYRKTKSLDDRYPRYAADGATVTGEIEDGGEWLRISGNVYLPTRVGAIPILERVAP